MSGIGDVGNPFRYVKNVTRVYPHQESQSELKLTLSRPSEGQKRVEDPVRHVQSGTANVITMRDEESMSESALQEQPLLISDVPSPPVPNTVPSILEYLYTSMVHYVSPAKKSNGRDRVHTFSFP